MKAGVSDDEDVGNANDSGRDSSMDRYDADDPFM